ncbi:MAG: hypothetical protein OWT27_01215 [Firmicutes bacterium]|nr:hypothetical protein [Bacillota bacterium]
MATDESGETRARTVVRMKLPRSERAQRVLRVRDGLSAHLSGLERRAVDHFANQDLAQISLLVEEKRRLERRLSRLDTFIRRYFN